MSFIPPTHELVADALEAFPEGAELIRGCKPGTGCWADLMLEVQHRFSGDYVAGGLEKLAVKWKRWVILAWCPLTEDLWTEYVKARDLKGEFAGSKGRLKRLRRRTIHGAVGLIRPLWQKTRKKWMKEQGIEKGNDSSLMEKILVYLRK